MGTLETAGLLPALIDHDRAAIEAAVGRLLELITAEHCHA